MNKQGKSVTETKVCVTVYTDENTDTIAIKYKDKYYGFVLSRNPKEEWKELAEYVVEETKYVGPYKAKPKGLKYTGTKFYFSVPRGES